MERYSQNLDILRRVEALGKRPMGSIVWIGEPAVLDMICSGPNPASQDLQEVMGALNNRASAVIKDRKILAPAGGIYDETRSCQVLVARDRGDFLSLDNFSNGNLPEWVGVCGRVYGPNYVVLCNKDYILTSLREKRADFEREMGHELEHPWGFFLAGSNLQFYTDYSKFPLWLQEALAEFLGKSDKLETFYQMFKQKRIVPLDRLNEGFFKHDSDPTDKNICYKECRWFLEYMIKELGGLDPILQSIREAAQENISVTQKIGEKTGFQIPSLWKAWVDSLPVAQ
jgi:hypothetical protein